MPCSIPNNFVRELYAVHNQDKTKMPHAGHFYFIRGCWIGQSVEKAHDQYENRQLRKS